MKAARPVGEKKRPGTLHAEELRARCNKPTDAHRGELRDGAMMTVIRRVNHRRALGARARAQSVVAARRVRHGSSPLPARRRLQPISFPPPSRPGLYPWLSAGTGLISDEQIQAYCDAVAREFRPQKIILFGSYAWGQATAHSDIDLLVVMPFHGSPVTKARQIRARFDTPFALDLLVRRPEFIAARLRERDMFVELVMAQGRVMYESQHA